MKIRKLTPENYAKVTALLRQSFSGSNYEVQLIENLHKNGKDLHEWVCIHVNKVIAYIAFSNAFDGEKVCGLHLALLSVAPQNQNQGVGSELLRFSLRQDAIKTSTIFVVGDPNYFKKFGFEYCTVPKCPFDQNNTHFLSIRNSTSHQYSVGYEPEFMIGV